MRTSVPTWLAIKSQVKQNEKSHAAVEARHLGVHETRSRNSATGKESEMYIIGENVDFSCRLRDCESAHVIAFAGITRACVNKIVQDTDGAI